ncbi:MAG: cation transporter, partial [Proteobacteria bacterium]|nr:cation transporter [Pseudomonadota bacterium]
MLKLKIYGMTCGSCATRVEKALSNVAGVQTFALVSLRPVAPLAVKDLVIVGASGGEYGVRGHIDAFDRDTGERVWRRYTIPAPGEPGHETWGETDETWARGGGTKWITGTYDLELDLLYWGTGNPAPDFRGDDRPGDNLDSNSVLALDPDDGSIEWHYQWTPHDLWDY